ncbi:peptidoglycan DD-metalloendopeptidase family protein [Aeromicrobium wangtongii]|uniref:peptidoglycan DD-metalloendopeptidase family protein n=1 Tax=Aeromicrobium wangtongii TaxID=2969247 RepID=UPI002017B614|nr:peptidoglycan DD-metalloendopeptidase family protein [Aeromicrobium wangtongii]MCL3818836.1 peptidoglycan DD-metalloendopeptidase family protein [Aeromicrobium wangtongii]
MPLRLACVLLVISVLLAPAPAAASVPGWSWPLERHEVSGPFDPPADRYAAGHRGIDLSGVVGDRVRAVAPGRVTFAGQVGGVPVVTIDHGGERSTYQPVAARVEVGDAVTARQVIGTLQGEHSHCPSACLHLGRRSGEDYLDPLDLLGAGRFVLVSPDGDPPPPPAGAGGRLVRPVGGPVTSPFGMRVHPLTGVRKLHDGTDFAVPCGTPVRAAAGGTVTAAGSAGAYGRRITIRHGRDLETSYAHLSVVSVPVGDPVTAGEVIGRSGTTGLSTGCHLHFMVREGGALTDPMSSL